MWYLFLELDSGQGAQEFCYPATSVAASRLALAATMAAIAGCARDISQDCSPRGRAYEITNRFRTELANSSYYFEPGDRIGYQFFEAREA